MSGSLFPIKTVQSMQSSAVVVMARVLGENRLPVTIAGVQAVTIKVADMATLAETYSATPTVSTVFFNSLQTDDRWREDSEGYNFRATIPHTAFPVGDRSYRIEADITLATGARGLCPWQVRAEPRKTAAS